LHVDNLDRSRLRLDRAGIGNRQVRATDEIGEGSAAREAQEPEPLHEDEVRTDRANGLPQRLVEAADHRRHPDNRRDADDDTQDREARAHLVDAQRVERHHDDFANKTRTNAHDARKSEV
jgi:hypothetical protein